MVKYTRMNRIKWSDGTKCIGVTFLYGTLKQYIANADVCTVGARL